MFKDTQAINGAFGECHSNGEWLTNIYKVSASIEISREEIKIAGSRWNGHKLIGLKGTGTISGYKWTSELLKNVGRVMNDRESEYVTELILKLDDPEALGCERIRLKNVKFDSIPLANWEVGAIVEEEWSFSFVGAELMDEILQQ